MLKIEALGFCNFYVHIGANSGKCEMQGISRKILKNHILFSHGTAWREEENAESVLKFCAEIRSTDWYLQGTGWAIFAKEK